MTGITRRHFTLAAAATLPGSLALAQVRRPELARIFVPFAAGGGMDQIARLLAEQMRGELGETIIVENKTGAAGRIAIDALRQAPADGSTLMIHASAAQSLFPHTFKQITYNPFVDIVPVSMLTRIEYGYALGPAAPAEVKTLADYIAWVKGDIKRGNFGTPGSGTALHFVPLMLAREAKIDLNAVHYRGTSAALPDLLGGTIPALSAPLHELAQQVPSGKVRIIVSSGPARNKLTPQVPTFAEQGFPQVTNTTWYALYVSGTTPPAVVEHLSTLVRRALAKPAVVAAFDKMSIEPHSSTPAEAMREARSDSDKTGAMVKALGYVPES